MPDRRIPITNDLDIVSARVEGRNLAREMGFGIIDQARIATAISELARNVVLYAHSGEIVLSQVANRSSVGSDGQVGLQIICRDHGPGIQNVEEVLSNASATGGQGPRSAEHLGMEERSGVGLIGTRRLMDEFQITSEVGVGTTVKACRWLRQGQVAE